MIEWFNAACSSPWGPWLLIAVIADKILECVLGELARRQKIPYGSILAIIGGMIILVFWTIIKTLKKEETK